MLFYLHSFQFSWKHSLDLTQLIEAESRSEFQTCRLYSLVLVSDFTVTTLTFGSNNEQPGPDPNRPLNLFT